MKNTRFALPLFITAIGILSLSGGVSNRTRADWPQWRGRNRDGIATEKGSAEDLAGGRAAARLEIHRRRRRATRRSLPLTDVSTRWGRAAAPSARDGIRRGDGQEALGTRERAAVQQQPPATVHAAHRVVDGTQLYALGASGDLTSLDSATGKVAWTINVLQKFGGSNIRWGLSESPLVLQDRILVNAGGRGASIVALKKTDGSELWRSGNDDAGYSSAVKSRPCPAFRSRSSSRTRTPSVSIPATDGICGATRAPQTGPPTSRHRSSAATRCSSRRTTAPARRCSS